VTDDLHLLARREGTRVGAGDPVEGNVVRAVRTARTEAESLLGIIALFSGAEQLQHRCGVLVYVDTDNAAAVPRIVLSADHGHAEGDILVGRRECDLGSGTLLIHQYAVGRPAPVERGRNTVWFPDKQPAVPPALIRGRAPTPHAQTAEDRGPGLAVDVNFLPGLSSLAPAESLIFRFLAGWIDDVPCPAVVRVAVYFRCAGTHALRHLELETRSSRVVVFRVGIPVVAEDLCIADAQVADPYRAGNGLRGAVIGEG